MRILPRVRLAPALAALLALTAAVSAQPTRPASTGPASGAFLRRPVRVPQGAQAHADLEYARVGDRRLLLDLYVPPRKGADKLPVIVWVHGGGWRGGDKSNVRAIPLTEAGYAVASVGYRLSQEAIFPAQIHDCKAAVRWLRANADQYGLDAAKIGAWGSSAGGHLVALLGASSDVKELDGTLGQHLDQSSRVQAVCDFFGPADFLAIVEAAGGAETRAAESPVTLLLGGPVAQRKDLARQAGPVTHVSKDDPPFLILHGDRDRLVPLDQSRRLHDALRKAGVESTLYVVQGAGHGEFRDPNVMPMVREFFDRHLKGAPGADSRPAPAGTQPGRPQ